MAHRTFYLVSHPDGIRHVLVDNARNYSKDTATYRKVRSLLGNGLLTSDGDAWLRRRRIIQPAFHHERMAVLAPLVTDATAAMLARWRRSSGRDSLDVTQEMRRLALQVVAAALLGSDLCEEGEAIGRVVCDVIQHTKQRIEALVDVPAALPTSGNLRFFRSRRVLEGFVRRLIRGHRGEGASRTDLLSRLWLACEAHGRKLDPRQLRDEVMTIFLAGHETTANALAWTFYLVGQHPRVAKEQHDVLVGRVPAASDLPELRYTEMVLKEAMRLYPPFWVVERKALAVDEIGGFRIPAGSTVTLSQYVTHRHPSLWDDPEVFDPERFAPQKAEKVPRFAYFPFGCGPRQCIGGHFAMMEAALVLSMVTQAFGLPLATGCAVVPEPGVTLRPRGPILVIPRAITDRTCHGAA
jgi:cytochrome P450